MTASKSAKDAGLPSLKFVYMQANIEKSKLNRWYHSNRQLFDVVVAGVKSLQEQKNEL